MPSPTTTEHLFFPEFVGPQAWLRDVVFRILYAHTVHPWAQHVQLTLPADLGGQGLPIPRFEWRKHVRGRISEYVYLSRVSVKTYLPLAPPWKYPRFVSLHTFVAFTRVLGNVAFPAPTGRNVTMMQFRLGDIDSLPDELQPYYPLIDACPFFAKSWARWPI